MGEVEFHLQGVQKGRDDFRQYNDNLAIRVGWNGKVSLAAVCLRDVCADAGHMRHIGGVTLPTLTFSMCKEVSFDYLTGLDCPPPNWNEGLDPELTKDLHLIQPFHHLFDHMRFAITDFIYVRQFETEINIEIRK